MTQPTVVLSVTSDEPLAIPIDGASYWLEVPTVEREDDFLNRVPKYRSDLAFAAGFTGLALIFSRFTFIPWLFERQYLYDLSHSEDIAAAVWFYLELPLPGLPAPLALWLGMKAWSDLTRYPDKSGKAPATIGVVIGLVGTLILLSEIYQVAEALWSISQG